MAALEARSRKAFACLYPSLVHAATDGLKLLDCVLKYAVGLLMLRVLPGRGYDLLIEVEP